ncbi:MAG: hypothetical protein VB042_09900 [Victivallaceae bacterium]|nr:hypothetical protein [Victivallaceae bacterium]
MPTPKPNRAEELASWLWEHKRELIAMQTRFDDIKKKLSCNGSFVLTPIWEKYHIYFALNPEYVEQLLKALCDYAIPIGDETSAADWLANCPIDTRVQTEETKDTACWQISKRLIRLVEKGQEEKLKYAKDSSSSQSSHKITLLYDEIIPILNQSFLQGLVDFAEKELPKILKRNELNHNAECQRAKLMEALSRKADTEESITKKIECIRYYLRKLKKYCPNTPPYTSIKILSKKEVVRNFFEEIETNPGMKAWHKEIEKLQENPNPLLSAWSKGYDRKQKENPISPIIGLLRIAVWAEICRHYKEENK